MASMTSEQQPAKLPLPKTAAFWIASGFGAGLAPVASGTFGALWGLPLAWGIAQLEVWWQVPLIVLVCAIGIPLSTRAARDMGGVKDPGAIVFDEIASMPITFFAVGAAAWSNPVIIGCGFVLNRLFDIWKPTPARQFERLPEGLGIMSDDFVAGVYSCLCLHAILWLDVLPTISLPF
jgi:phosphatidylglycerophosphatase A